MASETSSYASSCLQSNDAPKELLELLGILNKKQQQQQQQQHYGQPQQRRQQEQQQQQLPQHGHSHDDVNLEEEHEHQHQHNLEMQQKQQHVELSQIELIYRAEGNANLVLALPQFKKVLRLPKMQQKGQQQQQQKTEDEQQPKYQETQYNQNFPHQNKQQQQQQQEELELDLKQQEPTNMTLTTSGGQQHNQNAVGILTMDHYVAYIGIIRCLLGNEFVFEADIVAVPNPNDRDWINEHIRPSRPVNRLDKEFGGHYGLLLPDATRLPTEFDILFSNLQVNPVSCKMQTKSTETTGDGTTMTTSQQCRCSCSCCCCDTRDDDGSGRVNSNIFLEDTYAIEIKPKQGWLLPNDVNNLFDIKPATATTPGIATQTSTTTEAAGAVEVQVVATTSSEGALKSSTDKERFTATQNKPSATNRPPSPSSSSSSSSAAAAILRDDQISRALHSKAADIRCRYCSMQFLKLKQQKIIERSNYCPLDLFSGVPERMWNALHALFICPQNNLRIFKNGIVVFDDQLSRLSKIEDLFPSDKLQLIKHLLVASLLRDYNKTGEEDITATANENAGDAHDDDAIVYDSTATKVTKEDVAVGASTRDDESAGEPYPSMTSSKQQKINICLGTPKSVPSAEPEVTKVNITFTTNITSTTTNPTSTQQVTSSFLRHSSTCGSGCCRRPSFGCEVSVPGQMNLPEMLRLPKNCVLQKILHLQLLAKLNFPYMLEHKYQDKEEKSYHSLRQLLKKNAEHRNKLEISQLQSVEQYLLAATAMDCSIMITFRQVPCVQVDGKSFLRDPHMVCINGRRFITKITLLDLDPKPDSHFAKYSKQTKEIAQALSQ